MTFLEELLADLNSDGEDKAVQLAGVNLGLSDTDFYSIDITEVRVPWRLDWLTELRGWMSPHEKLQCYLPMIDSRIQKLKQILPYATSPTMKLEHFVRLLAAHTDHGSSSSSDLAYRYIQGESFDSLSSIVENLMTKLPHGVPAEEVEKMQAIADEIFVMKILGVKDFEPLVSTSSMMSRASGRE